MTLSKGFKFNSWRIFVAVCGLPAVLVTVALAFLPESPMFLLAKGRESDALKVFRMIYSQNTGRHASEYPINEGIHLLLSLILSLTLNLFMWSK